MTDDFVPLRRLAALSVAIALVAAPIASAQTPEAAPSSAASANTALLNNAAFARLIQPPAADVAPGRVVVDPPRINLLRQGTTAMAREAQAASTQPLQQKSWAARHKKGIFWAVVIGVVAGYLCVALPSLKSDTD